MAICKKLTPISLLLLLVSSAVFGGILPIWEIEGTSNRVLLMGSVHYLRAADYPLPEGMMTAYDLADTLVMEIDMDSLDPMMAQTTMMTMGTSKNGRTLREALGDANYQKAASRADALGVPLMLFDQFEPWFAALAITQLRMLQLGFDPSWGIEMRLTEKAASDNKEIRGLETIEEQLGFMDRLDDETQLEFLLQSLDDAATVEAELEAIVDAWRSGDTAGMEELMLEGFRTAPGLEDALLVQRNRNWVRPILNLQNQPDNYLVIVGAMHLIGNKSVIAMLEDQGIKVRQLTDADLR